MSQPKRAPVDQLAYRAVNPVWLLWHRFHGTVRTEGWGFPGHRRTLAICTCKAERLMRAAANREDAP